MSLRAFVQKKANSNCKRTDTRINKGKGPVSSLLSLILLMSDLVIKQILRDSLEKRSYPKFYGYVSMLLLKTVPLDYSFS